MAKRKLKLKKGSKNNELPIDNGLPKAYLGAILSGLPQMLGASAGAMSGATAGLSGLGAGAATMGNAGTGLMGGGATMTGGNTMGAGSATMGGANSNAMGGLKNAMDMLGGPLSGLTNATMLAIGNMIKSFQPEEERRPVLKNIGATYAQGGYINSNDMDLNQFAKGGKIYIKPSKRGTFTAAAKKRGMGVQQFASKVLANKDSYSPAMVKKANFARNAAKWKKAMGGLVEPEIFDMGGFTGNYMDMFDYMALGGTMGGGDPTLPPLKPTSQDSALAYNRGMDLGKYYTSKGYKKKDEQKLPISQGSSFKNELDKIYNNFLSLSQTTYPTSSGKVVKSKLDPTQYRKPTDVTKPYTVEQRDIASNIVDTRAPFGYYDTRIEPQSVTIYQNVNPNDPLFGDVASVPTYDISTKPYAMRTPEEQAEVERKYGKPIPVVEPKKIVPITDLRNESKQYLKTLENLDDKNTFIEYLRSGVDANEVRNLDPYEIQRRANAWKRGMAYGGMVDPLMAFGGMIDPTMAMQQMMYGSYADGGQVPQNIPVEVEGEEMYEMPNGQTGEFTGPKHENGGIPIALPEGTKIYSDRLKVDGKTMAQRKDKREANISKLEKLLTKNPNDRFIKEALKRQQETAALEEQQDMATQEQANQEQQMQEMAMEEMLMGAAMQDMQEGMMAMGGMIKRADGSYSRRGLWDNIRANKGSGKKPTKEMLKQEKKIRAAEKAYGGIIKYADGGKIPENILRSRLESHMSPQEADSYLDEYGKGGYVVKRSNERKGKTHVVIGPDGTKKYFGDPKMGERSKSKLGKDAFYARHAKNLKNNPHFRAYARATWGYGGTIPTYDNGTDNNGIYPNAFIQMQNPNLLGMDLGLMGGFSDYTNMPEPLKDSYAPGEAEPTGWTIIEDPTIPNIETYTGIPSSAYNYATNTTTPVSTPSLAKTKTTRETDSTDDGVRYTKGDITGMSGIGLGMYGPTLMTLLNRLETPKNVNFFSTYGQDALRSQLEAEGLAGFAKDEAMRKNLMRANALRKQIANSARGVGDMRTQQLTAALAEQEGARDILGSYLQSMAGLKGQKANLQAQIDQTRMGGEYQRDLADRQDIDQYYTNLAQNLASASTSAREYGRSMNIAQRNKDILALSKYYSAYGIYVDIDDEGKLVLKDQSSGKTVTPEQAEKKKKKADKEAIETTE